MSLNPLNQVYVFNQPEEVENNQNNLKVLIP